MFSGTMRSAVAGIGIAMLVASSASAQWSSDPATNLSVADGAGSQATPIVRPACDGGVWIFFYDNGAGAGLKPTIQRLTAGGEKVFAGNGVVLANRTNTATFTSDMRVGFDGNAYAAFDDNSSGSTVTTVQRVNPDGSLPWGAAGIQMPGSTNSFSNRIVQCVDGTLVWMGVVSNVLQFQRINSDGTLVAGENWTVAEAGRGQAPSDVVAGDSGGDVISMWVRSEGTNMVTSRKGLKIQKWNSTHQPLWSGTGGAGTAIDIYTSSATPSRGIQTSYFPAIVSDGAGGAVAAWYDTGATRNAWLQHVTAAGVQLFAQDGLAMSTTLSSVELRLSAAVAYDTAAAEYVVAFERSNTGQSLFGLGAQRVDSAGTRLWGDPGLEILPIAGNHKSFVNVQGGPLSSAIVAWLEYTGANGPMLVSTTRLDSNGAAVWTPAVNDIASTASPKGRLGLTKVKGSEMLVAVWNDDAAGSTDIHAQNLYTDGSLGALPCPADLNRDGSIGLTDLSILLAHFGTGGCVAPSEGDLDDDGDVDLTDLSMLLAQFGLPCP